MNAKNENIKDLVRKTFAIVIDYYISKTILVAHKKHY